MFLDPFWHPRNLQPNHRTPDFGETLDELIKSIGSNEANGSLLSERISSNCLALSTALDLFRPAALDYVMSFCKEHLPNISVENSDCLDSDL
jgi:hypothetical protein